ncbi:hypothetical protein BC833DRAFT_594475 [Globomyces pollinis-pini]|nr:hypothetical protein BC833DRAFT_594475 [Globomyces pollinis-pini]
MFRSSIGWMLLGLVNAANVTILCKCDCGPNPTIFIVPSCSACIRNFCIESNACSNTTTNPIPWTTVCFQRGSVKDEMIIYGFIFITGILLAFALGREHLLKLSKEQDLYRRLPQSLQKLLEEESN